MGNPSQPQGADLSSNAGMGVVAILIILVISSIAMMGIMSIGGIQRRSQSQSTVPAQIVLIRGNIINILKNQEAWKNTANDPANDGFSCFSPGHTCTGVVTEQYIHEVLNPKDNNGNPTYTMNNAAWGDIHGFRADGTPCTTYPSMQCPISFQVAWTCPGTCNYPLPNGFSIRVTPKYNPLLSSPSSTLSPDAIILNVSKYETAVSDLATASASYNFP